jgi:cell division protein FtsA
MTGAPIVVLDLGTAGVKCLVGEALDDNQLKIIGVGSAPCKGLRNGHIIDMPNVVAAIRQSVEEAESTAGLSISGAYMGISGDAIGTSTCRSAIAISGSSSPIEEEDVKRAVATAEQSEVPGDRRVLHRFTHRYTVDGQEVKTPLWLHGNKLEVELLNITAAESVCSTLERAAATAGIEVVGFIHSALALSSLLVSSDERDMGVTILDLGAGSADLALFQNGTLRHLASIPFGGADITKDIAVVLGTSPSQAEILKCESGYVGHPYEETPEDVDFRSTAGRRHSLAADQLAAIIEARQREIIEFVSDSIQQQLGDQGIAAGVILTGGGAQLENLPALAEEILGLPVRLGRPIDLTGPEQAHQPPYATACGLLHFALFDQQGTEIEEYQPEENGIFNKLSRIFSFL